MSKKCTGNDNPPKLFIKYLPHHLSNPITSSADGARVLRNIWNKELINIQEEVYILFLNGNSQAMCYRRINTGNARETLFNIKLAMAMALNCLACTMIIAHNHPSGSLKPSPDDIAVTVRFYKACELLDINLADHIIMTPESYFSFRDNDLVFKT